MRKHLFHSVGLIAFALCVMVENSWAAPPAQWTVVNQPARLVNGSPVLLRVATPKPARTLSGKWLDHEIAFSFDPGSKTWFALAGASQETKPGAYPLQLHAETTAGQAFSFE